MKSKKKKVKMKKHHQGEEEGENLWLGIIWNEYFIKIPSAHFLMLLFK